MWKSLVRLRVLAPLAFVASMLLSAAAFAGTLQVRDEENLFSSSDLSALHEGARSLPFDVRVLTSGAHPGDFDRYVGQQVGEPNMVVVGIDKEHRRTSVHFGTGAGIAGSEFHAVEQAGNASFKKGDFRGGVQAILVRAKEAVGTSPATGRQSTAAPVPAGRSSGGFPYGWVLLGGLVLVGFLAVRRMFANGRAAGPSNLPPGPGYGPGYPGYGPGPGPGYGGYGGYGRGSGLGSGLMGAGLGGLAGYELGKAMGEREERDREGGMFGTGPNNDDGSNAPNWDAGGDSGGWDDGGGGGDWGGGGGDGGGGDGSW